MAKISWGTRKRASWGGWKGKLKRRLSPRDKKEKKKKTKRSGNLIGEDSGWNSILGHWKVNSQGRRQKSLSPFLPPAKSHLTGGPLKSGKKRHQGD